MVRLLTLVLAGIGLSAVAWAAADPCSQSLYRGFDSRLRAEVFARLPAGRDEVVGMEVYRGKVAVAFPRRVAVFGGEHPLAVPVLDPVSSLLVSDKGDILLRTARGVFRLSAEGMLPEVALGGLRGRLWASGTAAVLEVAEAEGKDRAYLRGRGGETLPLATFDEPVRIAAWGPDGLAVIAGNRLAQWRRGSRELRTLWVDSGLDDAHDLALLPDGVAVIALRNAVVLTRGRSASVVAGVRARVRYADGVLYLLDEDSGLVWKLTGLDKLGRADDDRRHAMTLLQNLSGPGPQSAPGGSTIESGWRFREAARILGCKEASARLGR